mgnify:CR=1 FL=1
MFDMFNYLKMKGFTNDELVNHFEKIEEMNQNINDILAKNPNAILKKLILIIWMKKKRS